MYTAKQIREIAQEKRDKKFKVGFFVGVAILVFLIVAMVLSSCTPIIKASKNPTGTPIPRSALR